MSKGWLERLVRDADGEGKEDEEDWQERVRVAERYVLSCCVLQG
jgi:hypothetical protein